MRSLLELDQNEELELLRRDLEEAIELMKLEQTSNSNAIENQEDDLNEQLDEEYNQLIGQSYRVPYVNKHNLIEMHEAEIIKINEIDDDDDAKLEVKFLYPLDKSMKYCSSNCSNADSCSFNHGYSVNLSMIRNSLNLNDLKLNCVCLFNENESDYWVKGKIEDIKSNLYFIRSHLSQELVSVKLENISPFSFEEDEQEDAISLIEIENDKNDEEKSRK